MQLKAAYILGFGGVRRTAEKLREVLDCWVFCANLRIVMSSIMRRRNGLTACSVMGMLLV